MSVILFLLTDLVSNARADISVIHDMATESTSSAAGKSTHNLRDDMLFALQRAEVEVVTEVPRGY